MISHNTYLRPAMIEVEWSNRGVFVRNVGQGRKVQKRTFISKTIGFKDQKVVRFCKIFFLILHNFIL